MDNILALVIKYTGLGAIWDKIDGYKTNIGAAGLMVGGGGMMLAGVATIIAAYVACPDHACQIGLAKGIKDSESAALCLKGFLIFKGGLMGLGIGHRIEKASAAAEAEPVAAPAEAPAAPVAAQ